MGVGNGRPERSKRKEDFPAVNTHSVCACVCVWTTDPVVQRRPVPLDRLDGRMWFRSRKQFASPTEFGASTRFLTVFFWKLLCIGIDLLEKGADKKKGQTDPETNLA